MMRKSGLGFNRLCCWGVMALALSLASTAQAQLVISQLFGAAGGNASAADGDFVEIFNPTCASVNLGGYSVQVASSATSTNPVWSVVALPNLPLGPGQYYCIRLFTINTGAGQLGTPYTADLNTSPPVGDILASGSGKAAIVLGTTPLHLAFPGTPACPPQSGVVDLVVYASTTGTCTEGARFVASLGGAAAGRAVSRKLDVSGDGVGDGCQDTNINNNDFLADQDPAMPRTLATTANACVPQVTYGACDLPSGSCQVVAGATACANAGGVYQGDCQGCPIPTACCLPTSPVTCTLTDQVSCEIDGGVFQPGSFTCPPTPACPGLGRCCDENGGCILTFQVLCTGTNVFGGVGTTCTGTPCQGACCDPTSGGCTLTGSAGCTGNFAGVGTTCTPTICIGACCMIDATCLETGPEGCIAPNSFAGLGTTCATVQCSGRCCAANGSCTITAPGQCAGTFTLGLTCDPVDIVTFDNLNVALPDNPATVTNIQSVTNIPSPITDLDVDFKAAHTYVGDLVVDIEHLGVIVRLANGTPTGTGCFGGNDPDLIFDDEGLGGPFEQAPCGGGGTLSPVSPPNYVPVESLSVFDGLDPNGDWTIRVFDDAGIDTGTLIRWSLHISRPGQACQAAGCTCRGDVNSDTLVNGKDIRDFAACLVSGGASCACADVNNSGAANAADIPGFISAVLNGACAP